MPDDISPESLDHDGLAEDLPSMLEIPSDADDEAMVELAIALSLREQVKFPLCCDVMAGDLNGDIILRGEF